MSDQVSVPDQSTPLRAANKPDSDGWVVFVILSGIMLPIVALLAELSMKICSSTFFDPLPTYWHIGLFCITPVASLLAWLTIMKGNRRFVPSLIFLTGASIGIQTIFSIAFLGILPISLIGLIMIVGVLGLAPYLALAASIVCARRLFASFTYNRRKHRGLLWAGIAAGIVMLGINIGISLITNYGLNMAKSPDEATSRQGVRLLRTFGSEDMLLRACYELPTDFLSFSAWSFQATDQEQRENARTVYYRVTGRSFNSVPPPKTSGMRSERISDFEFDPDVGGTAVNSKVRNLSMTSSRMDAVVQPDALTAYSEWTLTFANSSALDREARAEIALPPGGTVSRLTLWVNGEEREAAFSTRGKVRDAYQQVAVVQQKDPVLVTTCGPDRVLMQCFPVPPNGGTMKVRIGITSPLILKDMTSGIYIPPHFTERNFGIASKVEHSFFIESPETIAFNGTGLGSAEPANKGYHIGTTIPDSMLAKTDSYITCTRKSSDTRVWTPDLLQPDSYAIVQTLAKTTVAAPKRVVFVIDSSAKMKDSLNSIANSLKYLPKTCSFSVIQAGDDVVKLTSMQAAVPSAINDAQRKVSDMKCIGGIDNRATLLEACQTASGRDGIVLWIHGPQPFSGDTYTDQILQRCERLPGSINIISVTAIEGRNGFLVDTEKTGAVNVLPRIGALEQDLRQLFSSWGSRDGTLSISRERVHLGNVGNARRGSSHICRLWAKDEVARICKSGGKTAAKASELASRYQLVTPVSGAVVLETQEQYEQAGLKPVDPADVPTVVPEPSTWLTLAAGTLFLGSAVRRRRYAKA